MIGMRIILLFLSVSLMANDECIFCQMFNKQKDVEVVAEFNHCFVIKDQYPVSPGHLLIIPNKHYADWFQTPLQIQIEILKALELMKEKLDAEMEPDGYNIGMNCGKEAGQTVMHLHVHLIPRFQGDMEDPKGGVRGVIPEKQKYLN